MKKVLLIMALGLVMMLTACNNKPSLVGTWIYPVQENSAASEFGFTLKKDGTASSFNLSNTEYTSWKKDGDMLILNGKNTGSRPGDFTESMWIDELTEDHLVVKDMQNNSFTYQRKLEKVEE